jgi:hypothetical protein
MGVAESTDESLPESPERSSGIGQNHAAIQQRLFMSRVYA